MQPSLRRIKSCCGYPRGKSGHQPKTPTSPRLETRRMIGGILAPPPMPLPRYSLLIPRALADPPPWDSSRGHPATPRSLLNWPNSNSMSFSKTMRMMEGVYNNSKNDPLRLRLHRSWAFRLLTKKVLGMKERVAAENTCKLKV